MRILVQWLFRDAGQGAERVAASGSRQLNQAYSSCVLRAYPDLFAIGLICRSDNDRPLSWIRRFPLIQ